MQFWCRVETARPFVVSELRGFLHIELCRVEMRYTFRSQIAGWNLRAGRTITPKAPCSWEPASRFPFCRPSPNLSKIITSHASTLVGQFQGLGACGQFRLLGSMLHRAAERGSEVSFRLARLPGISSPIFLRTSGKLWAGPDVDAQRELRMFLERGREARFWLSDFVAVVGKALRSRTWPEHCIPTELGVRCRSTRR